MTIARDIAKSIGSSVRAGNIGPEGGILGISARIYDSTVDLPTSGIAAGAQGYVSSNQRLYIRGTGGWYNIATINNTPTINSVQTAAGDSSPFTLAIDGTTTTVITITATDSEGFPITFSAVTDTGFDSIGTVSQDSSVFTITPFSQDSAGTATSGTITFKASDGVNIASEVATFTLEFKVPQSNFTTVLMKASGDGGDNTTIDDTSSNVTITKVGTPTTQAFTPYHPGGYSVYTGATDSDYLKLNASTNYNFDDNGWQLEGWLHPEVFDGGAGGIFEFYTNDDNYFRLFQTAAPALNLSGEIAGSAYVNMSANGVQIPTNEWSHFAVTWDGSKFRVYLNGALEQESGTISTDLTSTLGSQPLYLMQDFVNTDRYVQGYMHDVRLQTGSSAVTYTGSSYTVPTSSLTTDSNTKFHLAALPYAADKKGGTVTFAGNTHIQRFGPYEFAAYDPSIHGASVHVDGGGDYLYFGSTPLSGNNGAFTIETWVYPEVLNSLSNSVYSQGNAGGVGNFFDFQYNVSGQLQIYLNAGSTTFTTTTLAVTANAWNHIAFSRSGTGTNEAKLFVNGKNLYTGTLGTLNTPSNGNGYVGSQIYSLGNTARSVEGYISDFRITTSAVYTSDFTPPTSPLTNINNTAVLTCNDAPNIYNAGGTRNEITLTNDVESDTGVKKYTSSMLFDGTGDMIEIGDDINLDFGSDDFTMEGWYKAGATNSDHYLLSSSGGSFNAGPSHFGINIYQGNWRVGGFNDRLIGGVGSGVNTGIDTTNWHHFAWTRNNQQIQFFIDGAQTGSTVNVNNHTFDCGGSFRLGSFHSGNQSNWNGNLEDIRITKGLCRYPTIPAAQTLTSGSLTKALTCYAASETTAIAGAGSSSVSVTKAGDAAASDFGPASGMKSVYLDGSGDYLYSIDLGSAIGTDDFCIEGWAYRHPSSGTSARAIFQISDDNTDGLTSSGSYLSLGIRNNNFGNEWQGNGTINVTDTDTELGRWYHFAYQRNGGNINIFIDGTLISSTSNTTNYSTARYLTVGGYFDTGYLWYGYISNLRVSVGSGSNFYSNSFTPPTSQLLA